MREFFVAVQTLLNASKGVAKYAVSRRVSSTPSRPPKERNLEVTNISIAREVGNTGPPSTHVLPSLVNLHLKSKHRYLGLSHLIICTRLDITMDLVSYLLPANKSIIMDNILTLSSYPHDIRIIPQTMDVLVRCVKIRVKRFRFVIR